MDKKFYADANAKGIRPKNNMLLPPFRRVGEGGGGGGAGAGKAGGGDIIMQNNNSKDTSVRNYFNHFLSTGQSR